MKQTANSRKGNLIQAQKYQEETASEISDFLYTCFQMSTQNLKTLTTIRRQCFSRLSKKGLQQHLSKAKTKCIQNSCFFSPKFKFSDLLSQLTNYGVCRSKLLLKIRKGILLSGIFGKISFLIIVLIWNHFSTFKLRQGISFFWAPIVQTMFIDKHIESAEHFE